MGVLFQWSINFNSTVLASDSKGIRNVIAIANIHNHDCENLSVCSMISAMFLAPVET